MTGCGPGCSRVPLPRGFISYIYVKFRFDIPAWRQFRVPRLSVPPVTVGVCSTEDRRQVPQVPPPLAKTHPKRARTDQRTAASAPRRPRPTCSPAEGLSVAAGDWRRGGARGPRGAARRGFQAGICRREGGRKGEGLSAHPFRTLPGPSAERRQVSGAVGVPRAERPGLQARGARVPRGDYR